ncbi:hypothetical protein BH10PSE18_BH10PSE18_42580 [soil metagenome]
MNTKPSTPPVETNAEPEITREESVPSDGRDTEGEAMMKDVQNKKLEEPGEREHKTTEKGA